MTIGKGCRIYITQWGTEPFLVSIGDKVTVTDGVRFITHDGTTWLFHDADDYRYQKYGAISVGNEVFIGTGTIILPGVTIGDQCVIGAGSVVTRDVESGMVYAGNPAKQVSTFQALSEKIAATCVSDGEVENAANYRDKVISMMRSAEQMGSE
ncbi:acyltransferase [Alteriqipengyuania sp. WL0013]|uniref:acyltransferase n=1 Tax=Alteriqipengyuania sp. WL0013 TaxID=3110773 RepID=UPI002C7792A8|nr:acyltransferase [Alteriqipengyuania sp. WL0013]MEB3415615.1 acyltransferase [Alteriqipengyuania sp. WL0013]